LISPGPLERGQALGQQVARDAWKAVPQLAEAAAALEQLAQNERRPALREDLGPKRDWTKLTVARHATSLTPAAVCDKFTH
jgi:hypothetical protein